MNNPTPRRATRRVRPPLWLFEGLDVVEQRRRLLLAVAGVVILVGAVVSLVLPGVLARTAGTGVAVGFAALLLGIAAVVAADATDLLVRGPRHVRAAGGELVAVLPIDASVERAGPLADAVLEARASGEGPLRIGVAASGREAARVAAWTDALGEALTQHGISVLRVDLASGPGPSPGLVEVIEDGARLVDAVSIEPGSKLARLGAGADVRRALAALPSLALSLPRDLDVLLVSLPAAASRAVVAAVGPLDHVLVVAQRSRTSRVELIAGLDAVEDGGTAAQVLLLDDAAAGWLAARSPRGDVTDPGGQVTDAPTGVTESTAAVPEPTAAVPEPTAAVQDPTAAVQEPTAAVPEPTAAGTATAAQAAEEPRSEVAGGLEEGYASHDVGVSDEAPPSDEASAPEDAHTSAEVYPPGEAQGPEEVPASEAASLPGEVDARGAEDFAGDGDAELGDLALAADAGVAPTAFAEVASSSGSGRDAADDGGEPARDDGVGEPTAGGEEEASARGEAAGELAADDDESEPARGEAAGELAADDDEGESTPGWDASDHESPDAAEEPVTPRDVDVLLGAARATAEEATAAEAAPVDLPDDLPPPRPATPDRTYRSEPLTLDDPDEHRGGRAGDASAAAGSGAEDGGDHDDPVSGTSSDATGDAVGSPPPAGASATSGSSHESASEASDELTPEASREQSPGPSHESASEASREQSPEPVASPRRRSPERPPEPSAPSDRGPDESHAAAHATDELPRIEAPGRRHDDAEEDLLRTTAQLALLELAYDAEDPQWTDEGGADDRGGRR